MLVLSDIQRNRRNLENMFKERNSLGMLYRNIGLNVNKPFLLKPILAKTIGKFWKFVDSNIDRDNENFLIFVDMFDNMYAIALSRTEEHLFNNEISFGIGDISSIREMFKTHDKFILSVPKNSRVFKNIGIDAYRNVKRTKAISKFTNSTLLNEFVRVSNVDEVLETWKQNQDGNYVLQGMLFKGYKPNKHFTNMATSNLLNRNILDKEDNLPLDKSGYNRYLYRRELHRRLNEFKSEQVFADYDNYTEVIEFKKLLASAKELFINIIRKRSLSKLTHKRVATANLIVNVTTDYNNFMKEIQAHFRELRAYKVDNNSVKFNSLDDVMQDIMRLSELADTFIKQYKKFER